MRKFCATFKVPFYMKYVEKLGLFSIFQWFLSVTCNERELPKNI